MIRLNRDLDLARTIQNGLLPSSLPNGERFKVAALNDPGQHISGDYYDVIERSDGRCWCLMADVTGEGVAAALLMANLQAAVRVTIEETDDPAVLLSRWNTLICRNTTPGKFITCLLALVDPHRRRIRLASAGHCTPVLIRSASPPDEPPVEPYFPLGIEESAEFRTAEIELGEGPTVFFCYTDGVIEAMNPDGEHFGLSRLMESLTDRTDLSPVGLVKHVRKQVAAHAGTARQSDDITILAARIG
jgi:sigma-B regulation protein RsbU (phosphoserine phosphatase)